LEITGLNRPLIRYLPQCLGVRANRKCVGRFQLDISTDESVDVRVAGICKNVALDAAVERRFNR